MGTEPAGSAAQSQRLSVSEFWTLLAASKLETDERLIRLRDGFERIPRDGGGDDARPLARWLVAQGVLTRYQAKVLLAGQPGALVLGDYQVLEAIEEGRWKGLFRARQANGGRVVWLQFLVGPALKKRQIVERIRAETARWDSVTGDDCIAGRAWCDEGPYKFIVLDEFAGESLAERLRVVRVLPPDRACQFAAQVAGVLGRLHFRGIAHGAIRAENILLGPGGGARLVCFPLARDPLEAIGAVTTNIEFAVDYEAPELQQPTHSASAASDVYALGCVLFELLAGQPPFAGGDAAAKRARHATEPPPPLDHINPAVSPELAGVVGACLAKNPAARFDAAELVTQLEPFCGDAEPTKADAPTSDSQFERVVISPAINSAFSADAGSLAERMRQRRVGRKKATFGVWAAAGLGFLAGAIWLFQFINRDEHPSTNHTGASSGVISSSQNPEQSPANRSANEAATNADVETAKGLGEQLWARPTSTAWPLRYLPAGTQMLVRLRPRALLENQEGKRLVDLPGPAAEWLRDSLPGVCGLPMKEVDAVTLAMTETETGSVATVAVVEPGGSFSSTTFQSLGEPSSAAPGGFECRTSGERHFLRPVQQETAAFFITVPKAPAGLLEQVVASSKVPGQMRREMEDLARFTQTDAALAILVAPSFVYDVCRQFAVPPVVDHWPLLETWFGRDARAALVNVHLGDELFVELRVVGDPRRSAMDLALEWQARRDAAPEAARDYVAGRALTPYSRKILLQYPQMIQMLASYTRVGVYGDQVVVRTLLPTAAAHNLYLAGYLAVREPAAGSAAASPAVQPAAQPRRTLAERLQSQTTLSFPNNSLEVALEQLAGDIGIRIQILGDDLEGEGITRNQSLRNLEERDKPAAEILRTILKMADPAGRLVYVMKGAPGSAEEVLLITTRAAAEQRGDALPSEPEQP